MPLVLNNKLQTITKTIDLNEYKMYLDFPGIIIYESWNV